MNAHGGFRQKTNTSQNNILVKHPEESKCKKTIEIWNRTSKKIRTRIQELKNQGVAGKYPEYHDFLRQGTGVAVPDLFLSCRCCTLDTARKIQDTTKMGNRRHVHFTDDQTRVLTRHGAHTIGVKAPTVTFKYNTQVAIAASRPNSIKYFTEYPF